MIFLDSFDHYLPGQGPKWSSGSSPVAGIGRHGSAGVMVGGFSSLYQIIDWPPRITLYAGVAVKGTSTRIGFSNPFYGLEGSVAAAGDGRLVMGVAGPGELLHHGTVASPPLLSGRWYYVEVSAAVSTTSITVTIRVNDRDVLTDTYTYPGGAMVVNPLHPIGWTNFTITGPGGGIDTPIDDVYLNDIGFFGDVNIEALRPIAPDTSMWIPSPVLAHWRNVDDVTPDGGATTVKSKYRDDLDLYLMTQLPIGLAIKATQGVVCSKVDVDQVGPAYKMQYGSGVGAILSDEKTPDPVAFLYDLDGRDDVASNSAALNGTLFGYIETGLPVHP